MRVCESQEDFEATLGKLKLTACPHCQRVGNLIRHGFLRGYDEQHRRHKAVRAQRIFCSNRNRTTGCGRTFSVWRANRIKRLFLTAESLWAFLKQAVDSGNKLQAFRNLHSGLSDSGPYRIWRRFVAAQSAIRTALARWSRPPQIDAAEPAAVTIAHLEAVFAGHRSPIAAFQAKLQGCFM